METLFRFYKVRTGVKKAQKIIQIHVLIDCLFLVYSIHQKKVFQLLHIVIKFVIK